MSFHFIILVNLVGSFPAALTKQILEGGFIDEYVKACKCSLILARPALIVVTIWLGIISTVEDVTVVSRLLELCCLVLLNMFLLLVAMTFEIKDRVITVTGDSEKESSDAVFDTSAAALREKTSSSFVKRNSIDSHMLRVNCSN